MGDCKMLMVKICWVRLQNKISGNKHYLWSKSQSKSVCVQFSADIQFPEWIEKTRITTGLLSRPGGYHIFTALDESYFFQCSNCTLLCTFNLSYSHRGRMIENGWKFRCAVTHSNTDVYFFALDLGGEQVLTLATWETGSGERKCQVADDNSQDILHSTTSSCLSKWFQYLCYDLIYDTKRRVGKKPPQNGSIKTYIEAFSCHLVWKYNFVKDKKNTINASHII